MENYRTSFQCQILDIFKLRINFRSICAIRKDCQEPSSFIKDSENFCNKLFKSLQIFRHPYENLQRWEISSWKHFPYIYKVRSTHPKQPFPYPEMHSDSLQILQGRKALNGRQVYMFIHYESFLLVHSSKKWKATCHCAWVSNPSNYGHVRIYPYKILGSMLRMESCQDSKIYRRIVRLQI